MKKIIFLVLILSSVLSEAQNFEVSAGANLNRFFSYQSEESHFRKDFESDFGYSFGFGISGLTQKRFNPKFYLHYDHIEGYLYTGDGGLGGSYYTSADVERNEISIHAYLFNVTAIKKIDLCFGLSAGYSIHSVANGEKYSFNITQGSNSSTIDNDSVQINKNWSFSFIGSLQYPININESISLAPKYSFHLGLTNTFQYLESSVTSMKHIAELVFIYKLK
ncbi:MAG: hypothetical protein C0592_02525 [Marinilabiliales bacterium]|nr:MAG: hypothetical protein C0592_02525 [Marinilabiliales bacterium]